MIGFMIGLISQNPTYHRRAS